MANETLIQDTGINQVLDVLSYISKTATERVTDFLIQQGFNVSQRWSATLLAFISIGMIFLALKISKPAVKWILILLAITLLGGLIIPW